MNNFKPGDSVVFRPGPRSETDVTASVVRQEGAFLVTRDAAGKERKVRPGACRKAA